MNWKGFESERSLPNFKVLSRYPPERDVENHEKVLVRAAGHRVEI
jgi:hypothetical protein